MRKNKGSDSRRSPTTISHHVNLTFDMRTSNIGVNQERDMTDNETKGMTQSGSGPIDRRGNGNGSSQDNSHGRNHNDRHGYGSDVDSLQGRPSGNCPGVVNVAGVQHMKSSDDCVGMEAEVGLKECGRPFGNSHTAGIPTVETTLAPARDNRNKRPRITNVLIHTDEIISRQMEMFVPSCPPDLKRHCKEDRRLECESVAINVLKTGTIPKYNSREIAMARKFLDEVNQCRIKLNVQPIPHDVFKKKSYTL